ncbi:MAG: hypothetical protein COT35_12620, partial [Nitrospirae bacterium CG08_land_8_20_14_0_20_52_24]
MLKRSLEYSVLLAVTFVSLFIFSGCESQQEKITRHREKGISYLERENPNGALVEFNNLVKLTPESAEAHFLLGKAYGAK